MNTLTNERLNKIASWRKTYGDAHNVMMPAHEAEELVSRLLAAEVEVTSLKRERETMHSIEYVQGVLARTAELEAQLAELRGQKCIVAWQSKGEPWKIILDRDIEEVRKTSGSWLPLSVVAVPPAASQPVTDWKDEFAGACFTLATITDLLDIPADDVNGEPSQIFDAIEALKQRASQPYTVPDEAKSRELFEAWFSVDCSFDCSPEATDADNYAWKESLWHTWEHCRAAMLQSQPASCGYTVPDEISVAEAIERLKKDPTSSPAVAYQHGWKDRSAAMLQSGKAEQVTQFRPIADLYELRLDGHFYDFTDEAERAISHVKMPNCSIIEYVKLSRLQDAMLQAGNSPVVPDGWVMVPMKLTAENGAKSVLCGEFSESANISCTECFGDDACENCDGSGLIRVKVPVSWTTIKAIWAKGVEHFTTVPQHKG